MQGQDQEQYFCKEVLLLQIPVANLKTLLLSYTFFVIDAQLSKYSILGQIRAQKGHTGAPADQLEILKST